MGQKLCEEIVWFSVGGYTYHNTSFLYHDWEDHLGKRFVWNVGHFIHNHHITTLATKGLYILNNKCEYFLHPKKWKKKQNTKLMVGWVRLVSLMVMASIMAG